MSGFAVIYERSNIPVEPGILERVMERLSHRGPDGSAVYEVGNIVLGHWHFWTTPEEVGERQPLKLPALPFQIVLDGRLDNRTELIVELGIPLSEANGISDAALILHSYERWGKHCFEHFIGPFALALFDERLGELLCARDALGERTLFYKLDTNRLVVASEPWAVAGAEDKNPEQDDVGVAYYFAIKAPEDGRTFFKDILELLPAQVLEVNLSNEHRWRYWQADLSAKVRYQSDEEYAEHFRFLLEQSVRCQLRSISPVGVMMSGGLDSTSVACLAAQLLAPEPLTTFSYVFDELSDCDERKYINAVQARWGIRSVQIPCDDLWPFKDWEQWPHNPNCPEGSLHRLIKERIYQRTKQEGLRVLLTGSFGDELYLGAGEWLVDLIADRRMKEAVQELAFYIRRAGFLWTWDSGLRQVVAKAFRAILGNRWLRSRRTIPLWLNSASIKLLFKSAAGKDAPPRYPTGLIGLENALYSTKEIFNTSQNMLDVRHPYRDRRLVEFVLAIPAYQLIHRGYYKHILRIAMHDFLPEIIRARPSGTSLGPLFKRGMEREKAVQQSCFLNPQAAWRKFVNVQWMKTRWNVFPEEDSTEAIIPWLCIAYETWYQRFISSAGNISFERSPL